MNSDLDISTLAGNADSAAAFLKSIANRNRLLVLCSLMADEMSAGDLSRRLGVTPANLSQHLAWLKREGLVHARREGTAMHYSLSDGRVAPLMSALYDMFCTPDAAGAAISPPNT